MKNSYGVFPGTKQRSDMGGEKKIVLYAVGFWG